MLPHFGVRLREYITSLAMVYTVWNKYEIWRHFEYFTLSLSVVQEVCGFNEMLHWDIPGWYLVVQGRVHQGTMENMRTQYFPAFSTNQLIPAISPPTNVWGFSRGLGGASTCNFFQQTQNIWRPGLPMSILWPTSWIQGFLQNKEKFHIFSGFPSRSNLEGRNLKSWNLCYLYMVINFVSWYDMPLKYGDSFFSLFSISITQVSIYNFRSKLEYSNPQHEIDAPPPPPSIFSNISVLPPISTISHYHN